MIELNRDILRKLPLALRIEIEENAQRKPLTQSELAHVQQRILAELRKHTAPGTRSDLMPPTSAKDFAQVGTNRATRIVAALFNESDRQVEKRLAVVAAAEAEPERFGKLLADMDRTGRVNHIYKRLRVVQQAERIRAEPPPLPTRGPYRVPVIDFPWPYEPGQADTSQRAARPYPTMSIDQMCDFARRLQPLLHADLILWLWCTNFHLVRYAAPVLDALGVRERSILTWVKSNFGHGDLLRSQTEHCIMAVRGHPTVTLTNESTVLFAPATSHSAKPKEFYELVERLCPAPRYLDVFSRYRHNACWDCYGDEAPPDADSDCGGRRHD